MSGKKCPKTVSYPTAGVARKVLLNHKPDLTGKYPVRFYWCGQHKAYHVTSHYRFRRR